MSEVVNVVCMKWGTKYPAPYVNNLASMVKRNLTLPYRFVCFTDDATGLDDDIEILPLPVINVPPKYDVSPWRKLGMFSKELGDLKGKTLFLDVDVLITGSLDDFFTHSDKFCIIENWTQKGQGIGNSSVYCFTVGKHIDVLEHYNENMDNVLSSYDNEQMYLSKKIGDIVYWPDEWCRSFKRHLMPKGILKYFMKPSKPDAQTRIVVFHGRPEIPEALTGGFHGSWRKFVRACPWISDLWR